MSFLLLLCAATGLAWLAGRTLGARLTPRDAMRGGMGAGFVFTGADHFVNGINRYVPMMPAMLAEHALAWVWFTGAAELAGGLALLVPVAVYRRLGLPNLHPLAGVSLAVLLVCVVPANISVALRGESVDGLDFGAWYFWIRPFFQPLFVAWALYSVGMWSKSVKTISGRWSS